MSQEHALTVAPGGVVAKRSITPAVFYAMPKSIEDLKFLGGVFAASGMFKDVHSAAQAIVKIVYGRELGILPMHAMTKIFIVKDRLMIAAEIMALKINTSSTHRYKVLQHSAGECAIAFYHVIKDFGDDLAGLYEWKKYCEDHAVEFQQPTTLGANGPRLSVPYYRTEIIGRCLCEFIRVSYFSWAMAENAGLTKADSNWAKWPMNMLFARTLSNGGRWYCPEAIHGLYTVEEMGVPLDESGIPMAETVENVPIENERSVESIYYTEQVFARLSPEKRDILNQKFIDPSNDDATYLGWIKTQAEAFGVPPYESNIPADPPQGDRIEDVRPDVLPSEILSTLADLDIGGETEV